MNTKRQHLGFSLTEVIVVLTVIGTLASVAIASYGNLSTKGNEIAAQQRAEMLNRGLIHFIHNYGDFSPAAISSSTADESIVKLALQFGNPELGRKPGLPYIDLRYNPRPGSDPATYRLQWTGRYYKVLKNGVPGSGLVVPLDGSDFTANPITPPNGFSLGGS
jgi:prepilin-type N-terminal cleavage/methylation domain-containing protein